MLPEESTESGEGSGDALSFSSPSTRDPVAREPDDRPAQGNWSFTISRMLLWVTLLAVFLASHRWVPSVVHEASYAYHRGKQRAEYEASGDHLARDPLSQFTSAFESVSKRVGPSVVHINVRAKGDPAPGLRQAGVRFASGQGSGVVIDRQGFVVTNEHVVRDAEEIEVRFSDGRAIKAQLIGADRETDLALLRVDADGLIAAEWGDSEAEEEGAPVWAIGSPFGLRRSVTFGILSAKHRAGLAGTAYQDYLQSDAAVNPGNSGGPLVNSRGQVIGINTAIVGESYQGVSFSIPSSVVKGICARLRSEGAVVRGWFGVQLGEVTEETARRLGLPKPRGAMVVELVDVGGQESPARVAGLQQGDVILRWNGVEIADYVALQNRVAEMTVGEGADVLIRRGQMDVVRRVLVGRRPANLAG